MRNTVLLGIVVVALTSMQPVYAQLESTCEDHCKINSNLAGLINVPLNPTAQLVTVGWGFVGGVGYNFNKRNAIISEFMWNRASMQRPAPDRSRHRPARLARFCTHPR